MQMQSAGRSEILQIIEQASGQAMDQIITNAPGHIERAVLEHHWNGGPPPHPETPVRHTIVHCYTATMAAAGISTSADVQQISSWHQVVHLSWSHAMAEVAAQARSEARRRFEAEDDETATQLALRAARATLSYLASMSGHVHGDDQDLAKTAGLLRDQPGNDGPIATAALIPMERLLRAVTDDSTQGREKARIAARMLCANKPHRPPES